MTADRYLIRRAVTPADLRGARELVLDVANRDFGYGYLPQWHWDLDRMLETYVDNDRQAMFVAIATADPAVVAPVDPAVVAPVDPAVVAPADPAVVATAAIRIGGPQSPPHAGWLADRYADRAGVAQLMRVATRADHRRHGLARRLVATCLDFARRDGRYRTVYLHTNARVPGAEAFWRSLPVVEVYDARGDATEVDQRFETIHFELPLDAPLP
ncbi:GNAT family N-acetyltransferase [Actinomycetes bacterium KLBMP 9797]